MAEMRSVAGVICLVTDLEKAVGFYETLGFVVKKRVPDISATAYLNWFWIEFLLEGKVVTEAFKEDVATSTKGAGQYIHVNVENVDDFYETIRAKEIEPLDEPQDRPWGHREFVLQDPFGYKLVFFSKVKAV